VARPRHRRPELEKILRHAEQQKWKIKGGGDKHFTMYCPCPEKHKKSISTTPSGPNYLRNLLGELKRKTCWKDES
jgi:hypothetical protein